MTELRYEAEDKTWEVALRTEGLNEEEVAFLETLFQAMKVLWQKTYSHMKPCSEFREK